MTAQPERDAHVGVANKSASVQADTLPVPAQAAARPLVTEALQDQDPASAPAEGPQAMFVDDTQDNASGTQTPKPEARASPPKQCP